MEIIKKIIQLLQSGDANNSLEAVSLINENELVDYFENRYGLFLKHFGTNLPNLFLLENLSLYDIQQQIPDGLYDLINLQTIHLHNFEGCLSPKINQLKNLTHLALTGSKLQKIPIELFDLKKLTYLDLHCYNGIDIPAELGNLEHLENLVLFGIKTLPDVLSYLKKLKTFQIQHSEIEQLPNSFCNCYDLESIVVINTKLKTISPKIQNLRNLNRVYLYGNCLEGVLDFSKNKNLESLSLINNGLTAFPQIPDTLTNLELSNNQISKLPISTNTVRYLYLSGNKIANIDQIHIQFPNVKMLDLSNNMLAQIPDSLTKMQNLVSVKFANNPFFKTPSTLSKMKGYLPNGAEITF